MVHNFTPFDYNLREHWPKTFIMLRILVVGCKDMIESVKSGNFVTKISNNIEWSSKTFWKITPNVKTNLKQQQIKELVPVNFY